ncbi:MAG: AAA family ATPase [Bacilli bacterium]|nr:AAA family ATPase [Bacilli bacterium]
MYLKQIVTNGFKSFADKIDIKLDNKITCIVGPNGSGKSNIVDAVRWVLGEQSVKSLRGDGSMSDVIFSGSKSRNALNVAWVELLFDNSDRYLNVPYTEISIKRRVYRSGENEYYLNNEKCRLKDIINLLLDSGVGKESFNIISQGEVDRIISTSPIDRRVILEEAAGILKYKKRKEEALRKLDRTHNNLDRVNDIIAELELQVTPLKEQSKKAKEYLENKEGLEQYEVALLARDIQYLSNEIEKNKLKREQLGQEILILSNESSSSDAKMMEDNQRLEQYEKEFSNINSKLLEVTEEVERINGERKLLKERANANKNESEVAEQLRNLLDQKGTLNKNIQLLTMEIETITDHIDEFDKKIEDIKKKMDQLLNQRAVEQDTYSKLDQSIINTKHRIDSLMVEMDHGGNIPNSVRRILKSNSLSGICDTIGNIIQTDQKYMKALEVAISCSKNFIITEDEISSKNAINYLKDNCIGRATFFPLTVIKPRYIDKNVIEKIENNTDFIAVLSDVVEYDKKYENIIYNQLGTTLVSSNIDSATRLSKVISHRYKVVTLEGDVVHVGGSMSGGSSYQYKSMMFLKQGLNTLEMNLKNYEQTMVLTKDKIEEINKKLEDVNEQYVTLSHSKTLEGELLDTKGRELESLGKDLEAMNREIESLKGLKNNSLSEIEEDFINQYNLKNATKEKLSLDSKNLSKKIEKLKDELEKRSADEKIKNQNIRDLEKEVKQLEIETTKMDVKLDTMLNTLNEEYSLTYEKAKKDYILDIPIDEARSKVIAYKANIKKLGMVNLAAIEEFERVNTRYEFLTKQKEDLLGAEDTLLEIMNEMDSVMVEEFSNTYEKIRAEFKTVFKELFGGGNADLKLTDPEHLLTTGVEIVASPPGKKLTTISLLSGGEKTFTAISLLFSILNVKTVPFCLFDEVEAALDEANVEAFGKYLAHYKEKTQFLIITHKKKTMEFSDTLYGITMQESGVSKLVSVQLNEKTEVLG